METVANTYFSFIMIEFYRGFAKNAGVENDLMF